MSETRETVLRVEGMTCGHCVRHVEEALRSVAGVEDVEVRLDAGEARVRHAGSVEAMLAALRDEGYEGAEAA